MAIYIKTLKIADAYCLTVGSVRQSLIDVHFSISVMVVSLIGRLSRRGALSDWLRIAASCTSKHALTKHLE